MSVQNGERLATKQDLADMYSGLLPYLGGMPEVLANKFSKGDMYSTDEKMIGQWIDEKPLYHKVVIATLGASSTTIDVSSLDIETFCFSKGMINNGSTMIPIPYVNDTMYYMAVNYYSITNDTITIVSKNMENATVHIAIQYTKTSDTAISIGESTDYSTDEKIIGTWIDGKLLYEKTIVNTSFTSIGTSWGTVATITGMESLVDSSVGRIFNGNKEDDIKDYIITRTPNGEVKIISRGTEISAPNGVVVILQYTKSNS